MLPTIPITPTASEILRENSELRRAKSREGFGISSDRFDSSASFTPGVGRYNVVPEYDSPFLISSPSVSKRGYKGSFASKSPKFSPDKDSGVPGPNSYSLEATSISSTGMSRPGSPECPSAAFSPSGKGRVPFPDPNPYPGPNAYILKDNPGVSPLLQDRPFSTFLSHSNRDSFLRKSDTPSPFAYHPSMPVPKRTLRGDIQWSKSPFIRFQDLGKDNKVPGPQRYFNPELDQQLFSPNRSLRSSGTYRGPYIGKQSERGPVLPTFGVTKDRFKQSFCGRLDLAAEIPGPGTYYDDLHQLSTLRVATRTRSPSPPHSVASSPGRSPSNARGGTQLSPMKTTAHSAPNSPSPHRPSQGFGRTNHVHSPPVKRAVMEATRSDLIS